MPNQPDDHISLITRLWDLVHHALRKESLDALMADVACEAKEFEIRTHADFDKLIALGHHWTGFGTSPDSGLGLFFRNSADRQNFPPRVQDIPHQPVESVQLRSIKQGLPDCRTCHPGPGANISWSGSGCHAADRFDNGTLGAFLRDNEGAVWLLSANHVISWNNRCARNTVEMNGSNVVSRETVAVSLHDFRRHDASPNEADAAIGRWGSDMSPQAWVEDLPPLSRSIVAPEQAQGLIVTKVGMPGDRTRGRVAYVNARIAVDLTPYLPYSRAEFAGQMLIEDLPVADHPAFSHEGDSGSLIVCETIEASEPMGLLIANNAEREGQGSAKARYSAVTPMGTVLRALDKITGRTFQLMTP